MWIKICANTSLEDSLEAVALGADALGFVFAPSPRQVTATQVRAIVDKLPREAEIVGVFTTRDADEIVAAATHAGLRAVQLHGGVDMAFAAALQRMLPESVRIIQTLHWTVGADSESEALVRQQMQLLVHAQPDARVLVDAKVGTLAGGSGRHFDWAAAAPVLRSQPALRVIVAGGLQPENVTDAVRRLAPWGVDVASGVEQTPGKKDFSKLRLFMENARRA